MRKSILDDPFHHMIEEVDHSGTPVRALAGAASISAAVRAYEHILTEYRPSTRIMLREGLRVLRLEPGTAPPPVLLIPNVNALR